MTTTLFAYLPAMLNPVLALLSIGLGIGALLGYVARTFRLETDPVVERINDLLPQTQCGQCAYPGCRPYAEAIAAGDAINKCPPGGEKTILRLADLLNVDALALDEQYGHTEEKKVAFIREAECIGCAKCIPACPVDAILGAPKYMHTVIESECTGCDLCVEPCPVDCIDMIPVTYIPAAKTNSPEEMFSKNGAMACINCGLCVDECPVDILPHELYWACKADELDKAAALNLLQCIECSKCDKVCPSHIPLVAYYQDAKQELTLQRKEQADAGKAKRRFENHQKRMKKLSVDEEQRRLKRAQLAQENRKKVPSDAIQAALDRVKAKKKSESL